MGASAARTRALWALIEVQNDIDPDKLRRWLVAAGVLLEQTDVLGEIIVLTTYRPVAEWALTAAACACACGALSLNPLGGSTF